MKNTLTVAELNKAVKLLMEKSEPLVICPKCGKSCYSFPAHLEAARYLKEAGYDGSCCSEVLG